MAHPHNAGPSVPPQLLHASSAPEMSVSNNTLLDTPHYMPSLADFRSVSYPGASSDLMHHSAMDSSDLNFYSQHLQSGQNYFHSTPQAQDHASLLPLATSMPLMLPHEAKRARTVTQETEESNDSFDLNGAGGNNYSYLPSHPSSSNENATSFDPAMLGLPTEDDGNILNNLGPEDMEDDAGPMEEGETVLRLGPIGPKTPAASGSQKKRKASAPAAQRLLGDAQEIGEDGKASRRKIQIEYIKDKSRRHITFSKRKAGIMKKAYELSTLTGTQVLLLVVSETGTVYTFTTTKLQPLVTETAGKNLIRDCLDGTAANESRGESSALEHKPGGHVAMKARPAANGGVARRTSTPNLRSRRSASSLASPQHSPAPPVPLMPTLAEQQQYALDRQSQQAAEQAQNQHYQNMYYQSQMLPPSHQGHHSQPQPQPAYQGYADSNQYMLSSAS